MMLTPINDIHSALNPASVHLHYPRSTEEILSLLHAAKKSHTPVAVCGGRHAMGGQQFANHALLLDLKHMNNLLHFDPHRGLVRVQSGILWPNLIQKILNAQTTLNPTTPPHWSITQKQTGADKLSLAGSLSSNIHGRGLLMPPLVQDIVSFTLIPPSATPLTCSRSENQHLFNLAIGGYGLFGIITDITLRLSPRQTLRRTVTVTHIQNAITDAQHRINEGHLYGDFQFDVDPLSPNFLTKGVFSSYVPIPGNPEPPENQRVLSKDDWLNLLLLAHTDKAKAFSLYAEHYLATNNQLYKSDTHQLAEYLENYHHTLDQILHAQHPASEMITELYVPPDHLVAFLHAAAKLLIDRSAQIIYGTIRLIQPDTETVLAWAKQRYACIVLNLHIDHTPQAIDHASTTLRSLIDLAFSLGGSYYLTYHRYATPAQLNRCYPRAQEFFTAKHAHDPTNLFQSDWYNHYSPHFPDTPK